MGSTWKMWSSDSWNHDTIAPKVRSVFKLPIEKKHFCYPVKVVASDLVVRDPEVVLPAQARGEEKKPGTVFMSASFFSSWCEQHLFVFFSQFLLRPYLPGHHGTLEPSVSDVWAVKWVARNPIPQQFRHIYCAHKGYNRNRSCKRLCLLEILQAWWSLWPQEERQTCLAFLHFEKCHFCCPVKVLAIDLVASDPEVVLLAQACGKEEKPSIVIVSSSFLVIDVNSICLCFFSICAVTFFASPHGTVEPSVSLLRRDTLPFGPWLVWAVKWAARNTILQ